MTEPEELFNAEYYQHLLLSLTLNSKALITELTSLAETYVDNAQQIVRLIEDRITKILPKYKLYTFYLLDSVIKNIGNPYSLLFAKNLYKLFTESYLIVEDTNTRQDLINLFQTWMVGQSSNGLEIFPRDVLVKIESFIIKATSLAGGAAQGTQRLNRDVILREGNYLLQYVIAMDDELDHYENQLNDHIEKIREWRRFRNDLVFEINSISEDTLSKTKDAFDRLKQGYMDLLVRIRLDMDNQRNLQQELIRASSKEDKVEETKSAYPDLNNIYKRVDVLMILDPNEKEFLAAVEQWGIPKDVALSNSTVITSSNSSSKHEIEGLIPKQEIDKSESGDMSLAQSLGLNFESMDFSEFAHQKPRHTSFDECEDLSDGEDGYNPEQGFDMSEHEPGFVPKEPLKSFTITKSSLKRACPEEQRVIKRVRFED